MFTHLKNFICSLFNIKQCQCKDEHIEFYEDTPEPDLPLSCHQHTRHIQKCPTCRAIKKQKEKI